MRMNNLQQTIKNSVSIEGIGLHTGKNVKLTFSPTLANHGVKFQRTDLPDMPIIPVSYTHLDVYKRQVLHRDIRII